MTPEQKLNALLAVDAAPARDYVFQAAVAARIARRRAWTSVLSMVPVLIAATAGLWGLQPVIVAAATSLEPALLQVAMTLTLVGASLAAALWVARRFDQA